MASLLTAHTQRATPAASHHSLSDTSTVVDAHDMLQRYERLVYHLSQQAVEQQAEITALRAALQAQQETPLAATTTEEEAGKASQAAGRHHRSKRRKHLHRRTSVHHKRVASRTLSPCSSLHMSSINTEDGADELHSITTPVRRDATHEAASLLKKKSKQSGGDGASAAGREVLHDNNQSPAAHSECGSNGLSPTPPKTVKEARPLPPTHDADCLHDDGKTAPVWGGKGLSESDHATSMSGDTILTHSRDTAEGSGQQINNSSNIGNNTSDSELLPRVGEQDTPLLQYEGQDAMAYLLSVFSSIKKAAEADSETDPANSYRKSDTQHCASAAASRMTESAGRKANGNGAAGQRVSVSRQLVFHHRHHHDDDDTIEKNPDHSLSSDSAGSSWQQRYYRIVAADKEEVACHATGGCGGAPGDGSVNASPSPSAPHDQSASELVGELIRLFTV